MSSHPSTVLTTANYYTTTTRAGLPRTEGEISREIIQAAPSPSLLYKVSYLKLPVHRWTDLTSPGSAENTWLGKKNWCSL